LGQGQAATSPVVIGGPPGPAPASSPARAAR
jgi:hypothetical protein